MSATQQLSRATSFLDRSLVSQRVKPQPYKVHGSPGVSIIGGYIDSFENDSRLVGQERYKTYAGILANTSIVATGVRYFLNLVAKAQWRVEPKDNGSEEAARYAEAIEEMMFAMDTPWAAVCRRAAMMRFIGFSVQEWRAAVGRKLEVMPGAITIDNVFARPQTTIKRWDRLEDGTIKGVVQEHPDSGLELYLPREKLIYLVDNTLHDSPEGVGLFRHLVRPAYRLKRYEELEGYGYEADLRGIPVGRAPIGELNRGVANNIMTSADRTRMLSGIEAFLSSHIKNPALAVLMDSDVYRAADGSPTDQKLYDIDLLDGSGAGRSEIHHAIERINHEIARILNCEHLMMGEGFGTQALSQDKSSNLGMVVDAVLGDIVEAMERDWLTPIFELNGWPLEMRPYLKTEPAKASDVTQVTQALREMATAGAVLDPRDPVINDVRDLMGVRRVPEELANEAAERIIMAMLPEDDQGSDDGGKVNSESKLDRKPKSDDKNKPSKAQRKTTAPRGRVRGEGEPTNPAANRTKPRPR